ncbi:hypothetical protein GUJ93_ZPchr0012g20799 [Zizania palustris]|uniref:Uncharacterized protein n=1 Tax=Zizania palustris TaxID=103762 RepID=A0A8J6BNK7_ZIZPA|nr:hypothetical protein GUJ93_ZPchr0012g20799 [Zizania palustris]
MVVVSPTAAGISPATPPWPSSPRQAVVSPARSSSPHKAIDSPLGHHLPYRRRHIPYHVVVSPAVRQDLASSVVVL